MPAPSARHGHVSAGQRTQLAAIFANQSLSMALMTASAQLDASTAAYVPAIPVMTATAQLDAASGANIGITGPALLTASALLYPPGAPNIGYSVALLTATAQLDTPTVSLQELLALLTASAQLDAPTANIRITGLALLSATVLFYAGAWLNPSANKAPLLRADVYSAASARLGLGPITQIADWEYGQGVDEIGDAVLTLFATDTKVADIVPLGYIHVFRADEGRIFVGKVLDMETSVGTDGIALVKVTLDDKAVELLEANTGNGLTLSAASLSTTLTTLLAVPALSGKGWTGSVDGSAGAVSRRHDADSVWEAGGKDLPAFSAHQRTDTITNPAAPVWDVGAFGSDSGMIFGLGGYPLSEVKKLNSGRQVVNRIYPFAQGEGYPALTLKAASHGANFESDSNFASGTSSWSIVGTGASRAQSSATDDPVDGQHQYSLLATYGSGGQYYLSKTYTISGATAGRIYTARCRYYGRGANVGKTSFLQINETGGAFGNQGSAVSFTVVAGWQWVTFSWTVIRNDRTGIQVFVGVNSGAGAGESFNIRRVSVWESTSYAYPVEANVNPDGTANAFIENTDSSTTYGVREARKTVKEGYPTVATKAAWIASCDYVYDLAAEELSLSTVPLATYSAKALDLKHVASGVQIVKVGDKSRLFFHGADANGAWLTIDAALWLMRYRRKLPSSGLNEWDLTFANVDLQHQDALARLSAQMADYKGSETVPKQSNYTFEVVQANQVGSGVGPTSVLNQPIMSGILAIQKVTATVVQLEGAMALANVSMTGTGTGGASLVAAANLLAAGQTFDVTAYWQQSPTPVPYPDLTSPTRGDIGVVVAPAAFGVGPWSWKVVLKFETTKLPLTP